MENEIKYYNGANILNANCPINFSIGNRSTGKSFYWKMFCLRDFLNNGHKFIYIRRAKVDVDEALPKWFDDISVKFPDYVVYAKHNIFYIGTKDVDGTVKDAVICGYAFALSEIHRIKSMPMSDVETIVFDEFIPENLRYLKPADPTYEPQLLLSLYLTVARGYGKVIRDSVRVVCIANNITLYNPYFAYFGVMFKDGQKKCKVDNAIYAELIYNETVANEIKNSKIGSILSNTEYGDYALNNKAYRDVDTDIAKPPKDAPIVVQLYFHKWYQFRISKDFICYVNEGYDKSFKNTFKLVDADVDAEFFKGDIAKRIKGIVNSSRVRYSNMAVKSVIFGLFNNTILR